MTKPCLLIISLSFVTACAEVEIRPLKPDERFDGSKQVQTDKYYKTEGVRFFRPYPYLWITASEKGACEMSITYLPKFDEEYVITPEAGIGSVMMAAQLTNGWSLTTISATADSKAHEMVTAIGNLTGNIAKAAAGQPSIVAGKEFGPGLYRLVFKNGFVDDLELVFFQERPDGKPAKCEELKPPGQPSVPPPPPPGN
jgi:hypothetical protein